MIATARPPAIAYLRVSTRKQGESGLGIDAQRAAVRSYCEANGYALIAEYREIESGRKSSRPVLRDAIDRALATNGLLIIARLDRLARSWRFIDELLEEGDLQFVACDVPSASPFIFQILASVAQEEARATSIRTKAAMAAAKARGRVFGNPNLTAAAAYVGARRSHEARRRKRASILGRGALVRIRELRREGAGYRQIAAILNREQYVTPGGKRKWRGMTVWRAIHATTS